MRGVFVTGTDTGVGKTWVGVALSHLLMERGLRVRPRKPVESGCAMGPEGLIPQDAIALREAAGGIEPLARICPYRLRASISPERAAAVEGAPLELGRLHAACLEGVGDDEFLLVEGAGGFYSPLARGALNADLAAGLGLPVLVIASDRLGAISQALLTVEAVRMRGLALAGVILNQVAPRTDPEIDNAVDLERWLKIPVFQLPHSPGPGGAQHAAVLSPLVDVWLGEFQPEKPATQLKA